MKKILLILIILIILSSQVYGINGCSGTCTDCSSIGTSSLCNKQDGCSWGAGMCSGTCTICTSYVTQGTCEGQGGCSWTPYCGDGVCDGDEDCTCSDCEGQQSNCLTNYYCSSGSCTYSGTGGSCIDAGGQCLPQECIEYKNCESATETCSVGNCCVGECEEYDIGNADCGNGLCEAGETCINCETDCGSCSEGVLTVALREPVNRDILKRGTHLMKVAAFIGTSYTSNARINVNSPLFEKELSLYDDYKHNDEGLNDGVYANYFTIKEGLAPGEYPITITAQKPEVKAEETIKVTLDPVLRINFSELKDSYVQGERIVLDAIVNDHKSPVANTTIMITITNSEGVYLNKSYITNADGKISDYFLLSFIDSDGEWNVKIKAEDKDGNMGEFEKKIIVGIPEGVLYYKIDFLSPVKGTSYSRGESVPITIEVSEEGKVVKAAKVIFKTPNGKNLNMTESEDGIYSANYKINFNDPIGLWTLSVQAIRKIAEKTRAGASKIPLQITQSRISIEVIEPVIDNAFTGQKLDYRIKATYPNGDEVTQADLSLILSNGDSVEFKEIEKGVYVTKYLIGKEDGVLSAKIVAKELEGDLVQEPIIVIVKKRTLFEYYLAYAYNNFLRPYWWIILSSLMFIFVVTWPLTKRKYYKFRINRAKKQMRNISKTKIETEKDYFDKGNISKEDYKKLIQILNEKLSKAKDIQKLSENKLKKAMKKRKKSI